MNDSGMCRIDMGLTWIDQLAATVDRRTSYAWERSDQLVGLTLFRRPRPGGELHESMMVPAQRMLMVRLQALFKNGD